MKKYSLKYFKNNISKIVYGVIESKEAVMIITDKGNVVLMPEDELTNAYLKILDKEVEKTKEEIKQGKRKVYTDLNELFLSLEE